MKTQTYAVLVNAIGFHLLWMVAVFGAAGGWSIWVWPVALAMFVTQAALTGQWLRDGRALMVGAVLCLLLEPLWLSGQVVQYQQWQAAWLAPHWIWALWLSFAVSFHYCFAWLQSRYGLAAIFGGVGGVFSVTMGVHFGAASLPLGWLHFAVLYGAAWALAVPLLALWAARDNRIRRGQQDGPRYA